MAEGQKPNILELVAQLATLQERVTPHLPMIGQKLISDQLADGADPRKLAKVIKRSPSYVKAVANGGKALTARQIVNVVKHATADKGGDDGSGKE